MTQTQRKQWKQELMRDYPNIEPYFIDILLDLYDKNPEYVKKLPKRKFKPVEQKTPKEIVGAVSVVDGSNEEFVKKYFKEPEYIPPPETEQTLIKELS
jgi:hypothetical protein